MSLRLQTQCSSVKCDGLADLLRAELARNKVHQVVVTDPNSAISLAHCRHHTTHTTGVTQCDNTGGTTPHTHDRCDTI